MLNVRFNIEDEGASQSLGRAGDELRDALARATTTALAQLAGAVRVHTPVATGLLADSIFAAPLESGGGGVVAVHPPADVYAAPVEYGTLAHFPPAEALRSWVKTKFGLTDEGAIRSAAFLVARAIARRGTRGHFMFARAVETERDAVFALFDREVELALKELEIQ